ncbi:transport protein particle component [Hypoxylon fuscum]|nr:transport protein particle component [Hypoxylon fuscum]
MSFDQPMPPFNASDPNATFLSTSCLDFLLIELVPMTYRVAHELDAAAASSSLASSEANESGVAPASGGAAADASSNAAPAGSKLDDDEERDAVFFRLEGLGYRVGLGLVERFSRDRPRFNETLDAIKFICKDLWMLVFKKQVDNLKTNHRGVYVLTDNAFRPLSRMSAGAGGQAVLRAQPFLWFPCGVVRGALAAMGIAATVQAESNELPGAVFQIKTTPLK